MEGAALISTSNRKEEILAGAAITRQAVGLVGLCICDIRM